MKSSNPKQTEGEYSQQALWHVIETNLHQERLANFHLRRAGFQVYLPMRAVAKKRQDAAHAAPLFPNYLFLAVDPVAPNWSRAFSAIGVKSMLSTGGKPSAAPRGLIDEIRAREEYGLVRMNDPAKARVVSPHKRGDRVRVVAGAFTGFDAVFDEQVDAKRVVIFLSLFGHDTRTTLDPHDLKAAS